MRPPRGYDPHARLPAPLIADPFAKFQEWMEEAWTHEPEDANAMTLATATPDGTPVGAHRAAEGRG